MVGPSQSLSIGPCLSDPVYRTLSIGPCLSDPVFRTLSFGPCLSDPVYPGDVGAFYRESVEIDDRHITATPEGVPLEAVLAGLGSRFVAYAFDFALQVAAF